MKCPSCGLENPPTAQNCDCGYNFASSVPPAERKNKRNPFLAAVATLGTFGLGQLYNGKPRKAAIAYAALWAIALLSLIAPLAASFARLITYFALQILLCLVLIIDAIRDARAVRQFVLRWYNRWYIYIAIILIQTFALLPLQVMLIKRTTAAYRIPTGSMEPAIALGDRIVADMTVYRKNTPKRSDLLIFKYPKNESSQMIKRLIGLPGEKVEIKGHTVYINDQPLMENYKQHIDPGSIFEHYGPYLIPQGQYLVLGDNRDNSMDSRFWGYVRRDQLLGQARYLYWSRDLSRIGKDLK
jgi:signal peptidase I